MNANHKALETNNYIERIIRVSELSLILGVSETTIWRWRQDGSFPNPISLGPKLIGWRSQTVNEWFENKEIGGSL